MVGSRKAGKQKFSHNPALIFLGNRRTITHQCAVTFKKSNKGVYIVKNIFFWAALCAFMLISGSAKAQDTDAAKPAYLSLGLGIYDITQNDDRATDVRIEYRPGKPCFWKIEPWFGAEATTDGSMWGGGGLLANFMLADNIYMTPSVGVGLYTDGGSDKDLDYPIEFRSQLEGGYEFTNGHRLGVSFGHTSNADLGDDNPGVETLNLYYHIPVGGIF